MLIRKGLIAHFLLLLLLCVSQPASARSFQTVQATQAIAAAGKFYRTELYFGTAMPNNQEVTNEEWSAFLNEVVTPKFPSGFTVLEAHGQFKGANGIIVKEKSYCVIFLFDKKQRSVADLMIEEIRAAYNKTFQQESVMRLDFRQTVQVSF